MSDVSMIRGDTVEFDVAVTNLEDGSPTDLSTATATLMVKRQFSDDDAAAMIALAIGSGLTVSGNVISVEVTPAMTADWDNSYQALLWDLQVQQGAKRWTVDRGRWLVNPEVAQA